MDGRNTTNTIFEGQDKIKLVTHCRDKRKIFEQYILQEYLLYKIYNLFTDFSFRVRLVHITYIDTEGKFKPIKKYGFFIENANDMAERNGGTITKIKNLPQTKTNYDLMTLLCVFQYFVGNTDWSVPALHNIKLIQPDIPFQAPAAVPYDFDFCGVINTFYASPDTLLDILSVKKRLFRSSCRTIEELQKVFDCFVDHKDEIHNLYYDLGLIEEKYINNTIRYYDRFYSIISKPRLIRKEFIRSCIE